MILMYKLIIYKGKIIQLNTTLWIIFVLLNLAIERILYPD